MGKGWYEVTAFEEIVNITPEQVHQKAIDPAYKLAVEKHSGIEVSSQAGYLDKEQDPTFIGTNKDKVLVTY